MTNSSARESKYSWTSPAPPAATARRPEIDGVISVPETLPVGQFAKVEIRDALGPDLVGTTF